MVYSCRDVFDLYVNVVPTYHQDNLVSIMFETDFLFLFFLTEIFFMPTCYRLLVALCNLRGSYIVRNVHIPPPLAPHKMKFKINWKKWNEFITKGRNMTKYNFSFPLQKLPQLAALHYNNCMYLAHHCITLGQQFQNSLPGQLNSPATTFVDLVPVLRKSGTDCFLEQIVSRGVEGIIFFLKLASNLFKCGSPAKKISILECSRES